MLSRGAAFLPSRVPGEHLRPDSQGVGLRGGAGPGRTK